jgi:hypothetical protein
MSYKTDKFERIKNMVKTIDKYAEFMVNFNVDKMKVCSKLVNKEVDLLNIFRANKIIHTSIYTKDLISIYIDL